MCDESRQSSSLIRVGVAPSLLSSYSLIGGRAMNLNSMKTALLCTVSMMALAGCSPEMTPATSSKSSASSSSSSTPSPSISDPGTGTSTTAKPYTRGQVYGSCLRQFDSSFRPTWAETSPTAPISGCSTAGEPTCASGFQLVTETPVQMNCSTTPSLTNTSMCYFKSQKCVKLAGSDADENYKTGQTYGLCLRQLNSNFQPTYADTGAAFPIASCPMSGEPTCAAGFKVVSDPPVQMNCSTTPNSTFVPCYYRADRCMKI